MSRLLWFFIFALLGLTLLVCGWLVPAHLRAVDVGVVQLAGRKTPGLIDHGNACLAEKNAGAAQLLFRAAESHRVPGSAKLGFAITNLLRENPRLEVLGTPEPRLGSLATVVRSANGQTFKAEPFTFFVLRLENRDRVLEILRNSTRPAVQELLRTRSLTNTVMFSPSYSASGQALDAAIAVTGLLLDGGQMTSGLGEAITKVAERANRGGNSQPLEQALLDVLSLGQRLNWGQLAAFIGQIQDVETLRLLSNIVRKEENQLPTVFAAVRLSGKPAEVTRYLMEYSHSGVTELGRAFHFGAGGVNELLARKQRLYEPAWRIEAAKYNPFGAFYDQAVSYALIMPRFSLGAKWLLYLLGGCFLAAAFHYGRRSVPEMERPLQVRGFHFARELLFGLGLLVVVLLVSEPFLTQDSQRVDFPLRLRLPMVGSAVAAANAPAATSNFMNQLSLLTLLLFFVLQGLIYTACLLKLGEIRRQSIPARLKLKLLENEDHLFDAGLYLGFVGTIISLILVSLGVIKPSLMAAYSSTSFGIIFVSCFKIFNLRPLRRKLVLESEATYPEMSAAPAAPRS